MKTEEAIEVLNEILDVLGHSHYSNSREYIAVDTAIQALEKQIPKKPNAYKDEYEHEFAPLCPTCEDWLVSDGEGYCLKCGQAIRWED